MKTKPSSLRYSPALAAAIQQGRIVLHEESKVAVLRTGILATYEKTNWQNVTAPLVAALRRSVHLKAELRGLGYTIRHEHH